jgi:hypothetical protein
MWGLLKYDFLLIFISYHDYTHSYIYIYLIHLLFIILLCDNLFTAYILDRPWNERISSSGEQIKFDRRCSKHNWRGYLCIHL